MVQGGEETAKLLLTFTSFLQVKAKGVQSMKTRPEKHIILPKEETLEKFK